MECVSFSYGTATDGAYALKDIDLSVEEGTFVGLIGPSGAGKSTLASALTGAIPHHYRGRLFGSTLVAGLDTCEAPLTDIAKVVGSVLQDIDAQMVASVVEDELLFGLVVGSVLQDIDAQMVASVVEDELLFGLENFGIDHREIEGRIASALDAVGIADLRHREIATLSGGQKQKVAIAAILAMAPRVIVMDEPTSALDREIEGRIASALDAVGIADLRHREIATLSGGQKQKVAIAAILAMTPRVIVMDEPTSALDPASARDVFEVLRRAKELTGAMCSRYSDAPRS